MSRAAARSPGRGALGRWPAGHRLHKKLVTLLLRGRKSADFRLHQETRLLLLSPAAAYFAILLKSSSQQRRQVPNLCAFEVQHRIGDLRAKRIVHVGSRQRGEFVAYFLTGHGPTISADPVLRLGVQRTAP